MIERIRTYTPHHKVYYYSRHNEVLVVEGVAYRCVICGSIWLHRKDAMEHKRKNSREKTKQVPPKTCVG